MAVNTSFLKRLVKEDFDSKYQDLISKIAFVLNPAIDQIARIFNKGLNVSDLNTQYKQLNITVDANGLPTTATTFASTLNGKCIMVQVGRAQNLTNPNTYPTGAIFISFSLNANQVVINHVTGLNSGDQWQLTLIAYV